MTAEGGLFLAYGGLGAMAVFPIILGSMASKAEAGKEHGKSSAERMGSSDAYLFPLIGSATLFGFYLLFMYFNPKYINYLLTAYFSFFGVYAVSSLIEQLGGFVLSEKAMKTGQFWMNIGGTDSKPRWQFELTAVKVVSWIVAISLTVFYVVTKNWIASNILGVSFATSAITLIHLDSFKTGAILLAGLFVYDIFWVFGTNVMVKVAKSFDVPVKLLFPKTMNFVNPSPSDFCLLGLGDIVIPGIFVALCHRFDDVVKGKYSFFSISMIFYVLGLMTTMTVMHVLKAAQPALLYLSPACILSVVLGGILNGNLRQTFEYEAAEHTEPDQKEKKGLTPAKKSPAKRSHSPAVVRRNSPVVEVESDETLVTPRRGRRTKAE